MDAVVQTGRKRGIGVGAFLLALVTLGALAHVGVRMKGIEVAYDLGKEKRVNTQLEEERRRLNIEIGMLKDPVRVVAIARDKLKMGPPAPTDIVRLAPGQVLGARAPAPTQAAGRASDLRPQSSGQIRIPKPSSGPRSVVRGPRPSAAPSDGEPAADDPPAAEGTGE